MRPIQLSLQYFGSYTEKQTIDFDKLGTKGLYLITGDTGSGKTTLFDAIVFALYGEMSGAYRKSNDMRCSMAAETDKTEVTLIFELKGRQYTICRWLAYMANKDRGQGLTQRPAGAKMTGYGIPEEHPITNTAVKNKVEEILGITCAQFSQIAMIAQGDFMKLLMTETDKRIDLFRTIFQTEKYKQLQEKIVEEFKQENGKYGAAKVAIKSYVQMAQCAEDSPLNPLLTQMKDDKDGKVFIPVGQMIEVIDQIMAEDKTLLGEWNRKKQEQDEIVRACDTNLGVIASHDNAAKELPQKQHQLNILQETDLPAKKTALKEAEKAKDDITRLNNEAAQIEGSLGDYDELVRQRKKLENAETVLKGIEGPDGRKAKNEAGYKDVEETKKNLTAEFEQIGNPEVQKTELETKRQNLVRYQTDLKALVQKRGSLIKEQNEYQRLSTEASHEESAFTSKRDLFYAAQAGILAETLEEGKPCPVCGATHHPSKAQKTAGAPTKEQLDELENTAKTARQKANAQSENCEGIRRAIKAEEDRLAELGLSVDTEELNQLPTKINKLQNDINELVKKINRKNAIPDLLEQNDKQRQQLEADKIAITSAESAAIADRDAADRQIKLLSDKCKFNDKNAALQTARNRREQATALQKIIDDAQKALNNLNSTINGVQEAINTLQDTLKNVITLNKDDEEARKSAATTELNTNITPAIRQIEGRNTSNARALNLLRNKKEEIEKIEERYSWLKTLSDTVNGDLNGKAKIKLETYILAVYFECVIQKANLRLLKMTNNQFELRRKKEADSNAKQSGLDLDVIDHHSGKIRTVKGLSGGESFMASLSLALGLSDEIQSRAGGIHLDTMFVDEGFGSLDEDTRIQARNTLQKLSQEGNLLMGVISHVPELKAIEKQIQVKKDRSGASTAAVVLL